MESSRFLVTESFPNQPQLALLEGRWLCSEMIDYCSDRTYDWIGLLHNTFEIEVYRPNFPESWFRQSQQANKLNISAIVNMIPPSAYQRIQISQSTYWSYTCSLQVTGFGKVRFVTYRRDSPQAPSYITLFSSRLDWSPRKIFMCLAQHIHISVDEPEAAVPIPRDRVLQPA